MLQTLGVTLWKKCNSILLFSNLFFFHFVMIVVIYVISSQSIDMIFADLHHVVHLRKCGVRAYVYDH